MASKSPSEWYLPPEGLACYAPAIERAKHIAARKRVQASADARRARIADYEAMSRATRGIRSRAAMRVRKELARFILAEMDGEDTTDWTLPMVR